MEELISVIVPVYNAEKTLARCIEALLVQTYRNIEIILVNDGSNDMSLRICNNYMSKDSRIKVIDKKNGGVSSARNVGLSVANGLYVMFCDSDDWAEPNWCEVLISNIQEECLIMCGTFIEGVQSCISQEVKAIHGHPYERYNKEDYPLLKMSCFNVPWNKIFEKRILDSNNIRFKENISNGEDLLFVLEYLTNIRGDIHYLDKSVFHYMWPTNNSLSINIPTNHLEQCDFMMKSLLEIENKLPEMSMRSRKIVYTDMFNQYSKGFEYWFDKKDVSVLKKIKKINRIMRSNNYQKCCKYAFISHKALLINLYKCKNSMGLYLYSRMRRIKQYDKKN